MIVYDASMPRPTARSYAWRELLAVTPGMPGSGLSRLPWMMASRLPSSPERSSCSGSQGASPTTVAIEGCRASRTDTVPPMEKPSMSVRRGSSAAIAASASSSQRSSRRQDLTR